jgi:hypothetical protein
MTAAPDIAPDDSGRPFPAPEQAYPVAGNRTRVFGLNRLRRGAGMLLVVAIMLYPQAMLPLKAAVLLVFLGLHANLWFSRVRMVRREILLFYVLIALGGLVWCLVGYHHGGDPVGISDAFRLRVIWSGLFFLIFCSFHTTLRDRDIHRAVCLAVLLVAAVNLVAVVDGNYSLGLLSEDFKEEMGLQFGLKLGFFRLNSINIATMLFGVPYLLAHLFFSKRFGWRTAACLAVGLTLSILSGRRALWLCIALVPLVITVVALLLSRWRTARRAILLQVFVGVMGIGAFLLVANAAETVAPAREFLLQAFSEEDERSIQFGYLMTGHSQYPLMGSGFGVGAGYVRSETAPWTYELTYVQMLFNLGWIGTTYVVLVFAAFTGWAARVLRARPAAEIVGPSLLVGLLTIILAANSNPYMGSFDFLFYLGFLPFLVAGKSRLAERGAL